MSMAENFMSQNIEFMAKCATDSFMQSLVSRTPAIVESEKIYIEKYMEVFNKSLAIAQKMQKQEEAKFEAFGAAEKAEALFK